MKKSSYVIVDKNTGEFYVGFEVHESFRIDVSRAAKFDSFTDAMGIIEEILDNKNNNFVVKKLEVTYEVSDVEHSVQAAVILAKLSEEELTFLKAAGYINTPEPESAGMMVVEINGIMFDHEKVMSSFKSLQVGTVTKITDLSHWIVPNTNTSFTEHFSKITVEAKRTMGGTTTLYFMYNNDLVVSTTFEQDANESEVRQTIRDVMWEIV